MSETQYVGLYEVRGFSSVQEAGPSRSGFSIVLAGPVARAIAAVERQPGGPIWKELELIAQQSGPQLSVYDSAVFVHEESALLTRIRLPWGNCACFGVEGDVSALLRGRGDLKYSPHNVDSVLMASTILSIWLHWFNVAVYQTDFRPPFAM